jgi:hypothetical protein
MKPTHITKNWVRMSFADYCQFMADQSNKVYPKAEVPFTVPMIEELAEICQTDKELADDTPNHIFQVLEEICCDISVAMSNNEPMKTLEIEPVKENELEIVAAAKRGGLETITTMSAVFDIGIDGTSITPKQGVTPSAADYANVLGIGVDMSNKGMWLVGEAVNALTKMGLENVLYQIAADIKMSYGSVSNWARVCQRIAPENRPGLPASVALEIATAKYVPDDAENQQIIDGLIEQAKEEKWSKQEARSHVKMAKGDVKDKEPKPVYNAVEEADSIFADILDNVTDLPASISDKIKEWIDRNRK